MCQGFAAFIILSTNSMVDYLAFWLVEAGTSSKSKKIPLVAIKELGPTLSNNNNEVDVVFTSGMPPCLCQRRNTSLRRLENEPKPGSRY